MSKQVETERLNLLAGGYAPLPLIGKRPIFDDWPKRLDVTAQEIERWSRASPAAANTGILTRFTPVFDIDIFLDPEAAAAVVQLARERFEEHGYFLVRAGNWPKRAIPFRTDAPFPKISVESDRAGRQDGKARIPVRRPAGGGARDPSRHAQAL